MKKITPFLFLCLMAGTAFAGPVSRSQATQIARDYLQKNRTARTASQPADLSLAYECMPKASRGTGNATPLYYVFNQGEKGGFVVVSGDDRMTSVVGYVDEGNYAMSKGNANLQWWFNALEETMTYVVKSKSEGRVYRPMAAEGLKPFVAPMVKVNWGQGAPYNDMCPEDPQHGGTSLVGCTAVAMSQVLSKWQYPVAAQGEVDYTTWQHKMHLSEDLSEFEFAWDQMLPSYTAKATAAQKKAVSELTYACGLAVHMDYCSTASGAFVYASHLEDHFGIDPACNNIERFYYTRADWDALIKKELSEGRPVIYNGFSMTAGHCFVCDGYNRDGLFHINWGWDGSLNGYFALAELNSAVEHAGAPTDAEGSFNLDQSIVYGIQPKVGEGNAPEYNLCFTSIEGNKFSAKSNIPVTVKQVRADGNGFKGKVGLGVYDKEGKFVCVAGSMRNISLNPGQYNETYSLRGALSQNFADGLYTLRPICMVNEGEYEEMRGRKGSSYANYLNLKVDGPRVQVTAPEVVDAALKVVSVKSLNANAYAGASNALEVIVRNDGAMYNGPIVLTRKNADRDEKVYDNNYIIESGEEAVLRIKVKAPAVGDVDSLDMWYAKSDNDFFHNGGFEYGYVGQFKYELKQTTPGVPDIQIKRVSIKNKTTYLGEPLQLDVTIANNGGFYGQNLYFFIFPSGGGNSIGNGHTQIFIDKGETLTTQIEVPVKGLSAGSYFMQAFILENGGYKNINTAQYSFNIKSTSSFSLSSEGYGVYCVNHAWEVPIGVQCGVLVAANADHIQADYRYQEGDVVPAGTPVIVQSNGRRSINYKVVESQEDAPEDNLLLNRVNEEGYTYAGEGDYWYYGFDDDGTRANYGFYWMEEEGAAFKLPAKKCYLAMPVNSGKTTGYPFNTSLTGIENILIKAALPADAPVYTLSGVRVQGKLNELPKGLYIVGGKKVMVK